MSLQVVMGTAAVSVSRFCRDCLHAFETFGCGGCVPVAVGVDNCVVSRLRLMILM